MNVEAKVSAALNSSLSLAMSGQYDASSTAVLEAASLAKEGGVESMWKERDTADWVCDHCSKLVTNLIDENEDATAFRILSWQLEHFPNEYYLRANLGRYCSRADKFQEAIGHLLIAIENAEEQRTQPHYVMRAFQGLASAYYQLGRKDEARECLRDAVRTYRWPPECRAFLEQMATQFQRDDLVIVSNSHRHGLKPGGGEELDRDLLGALFRQASVLLQQGKLLSAKEALEKVLEGSIAINEPELQALCLHELGGVAMESGCLEDAAQYYEQSAELSIEHEGPNSAVPALYNAFGAVHALQDHQRAEAIAAELVELTANNSDYNTNIRIGCLLRLLMCRPNDEKVAAQLADLMEEYLPEINAETGTFGDAELMLQVHSFFPVGPQSERLCRLAVEIFRKEKSAVWERRARRALAECLYAQGRLQGAYDTARVLFTEVRDCNPFEALQVAVLLANTVEQQFSRVLAATHLETAIEYGEQTRSTIRDEKTRAGFYSTLDAVYRRLVHTYAMEGRWAEALMLAERTNSRVLAEHLANLPNELPNSPVADLINEYRQAREQMDQIWNDLFQGRISQSTFCERRNRLEPELDRAHRHLVAADPRNAQQVTGFPPDWREYQAAIPANRAYLLPFTVADGWILFVVRNDGVTAKLIASDPEDIRSRVRRFWEWIRMPDSDSLARDMGELPPQSAACLTENAPLVAGELYRNLVAPVANALEGISELVWIPDYTLVDLPIGALHDGTQYLVEKYAISCGVAVGLDLATRGKFTRPIPPVAMLIGNPDESLPDAEIEVRQISRHLQNPNVLVGGAATLEAVLRGLSQAGIVHFACHSLHSEANPANSCLLLAKRANGSLDRLTTRDLYLAPWQAGLLVFSSCQSGRGQSAIGNEREGMVRAALYGGIPAVIAALWPVDDGSTRQLMELFYENMQRYDVARALATAQCSMLRNAATAHPSNWAAFQHYGISVQVRL